MSERSDTVFLDLRSLGFMGRSRRSPEPDRLEPYPQVRSVLEELRAQEARLGVVGDPQGPSEKGLLRLLDQSGLSTLFASELVLAGEADARAQFHRAIEAAGHREAPARCVFVGEDREERAEALGVGMRVSPHVRLAGALLEGARLQYIRIAVPDEHVREDWRSDVADLDLVPLRVAGELARVSYAIATPAAAASLDDLGFQVSRLGAEDEPLTTELYLLRDDRQVRTGFLALEGASRERFGPGEEAGRVLASGREGLYVAIAAGRSVDSYHFEETHHGHTEKLAPVRTLFEPFGDVPGLAAVGSTGEEPVIGDTERRALSEITPAAIASDLARYTGAEPVDASGRRVHSRHVSHPDNAIAVEALAQDLEAIGDGQLDVRIRPFLDEGRPLANVEAELRGTEPDEIVLVSGHLDSTAVSSPPYDPDEDPAPGADDDASGSVGVLAVARVLAGLSAVRPLKRTVRFLLFNAEEVGLVGSQAYAAGQAALGARIAAVFQMDMVGYNVEPPRSYEVHVGFLPSPPIEERSRALAQRIATAARAVSPDLPAPQIVGTVRSQPLEADPADGRSDHSSFQAAGYAACLTIEDYFGGPGGEREFEQNPNYHTLADTFVDVEYAADIVRAVAAAAWVSANL